MHWHRRNVDIALYAAAVVEREAGDAVGRRIVTQMIDLAPQHHGVRQVVERAPAHAMPQMPSGIALVVLLVDISLRAKDWPQQAERHAQLLGGRHQVANYNASQ